MYLRKTLFVALLAAVVLPATSNATVTRVIGLGGSGANFIVKDHYNATVWPQLVQNYGMQAGGEFYVNGEQGWDFQKAYINYEFEDESVLQFALDKLNSRNYGALADAELSTLDGLPNGYNKINATYGRRFGDDLLLGASLHMAGKSYVVDETAPGGEMDHSYGEFGILLGLTAMEEALDVSLGFRSGSWAIENAAGTVAEADGASDIMIAGRYWWEASDTYSLIPNIGIGMHSDGAKMGESTGEMSTSMFRLGVGNNWTPVSDLLTLAEFGVMSTGTTMKLGEGEETTDSEMAIYWRLGVESEILSWLDARFGAERNWVGATWESFPGKPEVSTNETFTYLGASAHWNRFEADLLVNPSFLGYGPNFISGYTDMIFTRASITINFDEE